MSTPSVEELQMQEQQRQAQEERRVMILDQILEPAAKERLTRLALVKKDKVRVIEDTLIQAATSGKLGGKVTEQQLIEMIDGVSSIGAKKSAVTVQRRNYGLDEEEDNDDDLA